MINKPCLMGINPKTRECQTVCLNTPENAEEIRQEGLICVPASREAAKASWGKLIDDIYALAQQRDATP